METLQDQLIDKINEMLAECEMQHTPTVCNFISTKEGKDKIVELIQKKIISQQITIGQAINDIENEFNPNSYTE